MMYDKQLTIISFWNIFLRRKVSENYSGFKEIRLFCAFYDIDNEQGE